MTLSKIFIGLFTGATLLLTNVAIVNAAEQPEPKIELTQIESWTEEGMAAYHREDMIGAIMLLSKSAQRGHAPAQRMLGYIYNQGSETELALPLFEKAAAQGDGFALFELSGFYNQGIVVKQDPVKAMELLNQAADTAYPPALFALAHAYEYGTGTLTVDYQQALKYYQLAADNNHASSAARIIRAYELGELGFAIDLAKAQQLRLHLDLANKLEAAKK